MSYICVIAIILLSAFPSSYSSLRCPQVSASEAIEGADSIFIGEVIQVVDPEMPTEVTPSTLIKLERPITARFAVERVYRGEEMKEVEVATMTGTPEWGADFKEGESYVVYAEKDGDRGDLLRVRGCSRTRLIRDAEDDLELLRAAEVAP